MNFFYIVAALVAATSCGACGSGNGSGNASPATGTAPVMVPIRGVVQAFALPVSETLPSFGFFQMRLFDAAAIWQDATGGQNPTSASLYDGVLPGMSSSCATDGCAFSIASQNIAGVGPNIVALVNGATTASGRYWAPTYTNIVDSQTLTYVQQHRGTLAATAPAYVISIDGLSNLAHQLGVPDAATLMGRGLVIGFVRGKDSTDFSGGTPEGVAGAQIMLTQAQAAVDLYYPDASYAAVTEGSRTNADGAFYLVGRAAGAALGPTTLQILAAGSGLTWPRATLAMIGGSVVVAPLQAAP